MNLGESTPITTVQDKEVVLTSTTGQTFRMKVTDLAESIRQVMPVATTIDNGLMSSVDKSKKINIYFNDNNNNGSLIRTNIARNSPSMFMFKITFNSYNSLGPSDILIQGYMYSEGLIEVYSITTGYKIILYVLDIDNSVCLYLPRNSNFCSYYIELLSINPSSIITESSFGEKPLNVNREFIING